MRVREICTCPKKFEKCLQFRIYYKNKGIERTIEYIFKECTRSVSVRHLSGIYQIWV